MIARIVGRKVLSLSLAMALVFILVPRVSALVAPSAGHADEILVAMQQELDRSFQILKKAKPPVYFMAYRLSSTDAAEATGTDGTLLSSTPQKGSGNLQIEIRVGSPELDNFHPTKTSSPHPSDDRFVGMNSIPLEGDLNHVVLKRNLWIETEKAYRQAASQYGHVVAEQGLSTEEDKCSDFSKEEPVTMVEPMKVDELNPQQLAVDVKQLSSIYMKYGKLEATWVHEKQENRSRYIVNTEGTRIADSTTKVSFSTSATATASDGERVSRTETAFFANLQEAAASRARLEEIVNQVASSTDALRTAPLADPYCGPAMLKGTAAAVLFHEVLGHRLEASRQRKLADGKTFAKMLNHQILPPFISVYDRPLLDALNGTSLVGHYGIDDEGVKAQNVTLVKDGQLVGFLVDRTPIPSFATSNGHGRCDGQEAHLPKSRMANLMVESSKTVPEDELKRQLIAEAKKQSKPYGLLIERVESGLTYTSSYSAQTFQVYPSLVKRVYVDGRPDELVRGVRIVGTPLSALQRIVQTGNSTEIFNGACGADSGWVPQANCSPAILIDYLETERQPPIKGIGKVLPPPPPRAGSPT